MILFAFSLQAQEREGEKIVCPKCGQVNEWSSNFCIGCGYSLKELKSNSQKTEKHPIEFEKRNLGGPRLGATFVPDINSYEEFQKRDREIGKLISQFGWHFEYQIIPKGGGPQFVIQLVPLLGGVEYGLIIPSLSTVFGIRFPFGFEFGLGPNVLITGGKKDFVKSGLVVGIGQSINYGGVSLPLNLAVVTSPDGTRYSFVFGYAIPR